MGWTEPIVVPGGADISADALVVFGAAVSDRGPGPELASRLRHTAGLYHRGHAPRVVCSGGRNAEGRSEPQVMRAALVDLGVPFEAILLDEEGISTWHSVVGVRRLADGWSRVVAVSSRYHVRRILREARHEQAEWTASPSPDIPAMRRGRRLAYQRGREVAALAWRAVGLPPGVGARVRASRRRAAGRPVAAGPPRPVRDRAR